MNTLNLINSKIIKFNEIELVKEKLKNKKIVFTNGCFDIIHKGHLTYLSQAKELGELLWIGVNSDSSVKKIKGDKRPINNQLDRAFLLSALFFVDFVTIFEEENPISIIQKVQPNIHVKGGDYKKESLIEFPTVKNYGGEVIILPFVEGNSTTKIIEKIRGVTK